MCITKTLIMVNLLNEWEHLANVYHQDLDYGDLLNEWEHLANVYHQDLDYGVGASG